MNDNEIVFLILGATFFLTFVGVVVAVKWHRKKLAALARTLGGEVAGSRFGMGHCRLSVEGIEGRVELVPAGKNTPPRLRLSLMSPLVFSLDVRKTYFGSRALEKLGLVHDVKLGDPAFDEKYVVNSNDEMRAQNFLADDNKRAAVERLLDAGYECVNSDKKRLLVSKPNYAPADLTPERIGEMFALLSKLRG